jgi:hypothetical protein
MIESGNLGPKSEPKARVFISYSRKDMGFADNLEAALKARGFEPLIDRSEIYAFEDWWRRIQGLIVKADTVIFVLCTDAVSSDICGGRCAGAYGYRIESWPREAKALGASRWLSDGSFAPL